MSATPTTPISGEHQSSVPAMCGAHLPHCEVHSCVVTLHGAYYGIPLNEKILQAEICRKICILQLKVSHGQVQWQYLDKMHDKKPLERGQGMLWKWSIGKAAVTRQPSSQSELLFLLGKVPEHSFEPAFYATRNGRQTQKLHSELCGLSMQSVRRKNFHELQFLRKTYPFEYFLTMYTLLCCRQCLHLCGGALVGSGSSTLWAGG